MAINVANFIIVSEEQVAEAQISATAHQGSSMQVNNFVVLSEEQVVEAEPLPIQEERISLRSFRSDIRRNVTQPDVTDADKPHVVVGGKAKKIGKTSAYMLDMLSLDD